MDIWGPSFYLLGFPGGAVVKNPPATAGNTRDVGLIPGLGRSPRGGHGNILHCSYLKGLMNRGTWWATVHRVVKSRIGLSDRHTHTFCLSHTHFLPSTFFYLL